MPSPSLPFVVAPKRETRIVSAEVNGETCSLEFPVFGALRSGELIDIREHEYQSIVYRESSRLADALVEDGTDEVEAQRIAIRILSTRMGVPVPLEAAEQRVMLRHAGMISDLQVALDDEYRQLTLRTVTALISRRLPGCEAWTIADSETLPTPLQDAIAAFADSEKSAKASSKSPEELVEDMVDTLGKLAPPASGDQPSTAPQPEQEPEPVTQPTLLEPSHSPSTGESSTGDAAACGLTPPSSDPTTSPASPSPTSSKPSKKASAG
jgi:hypothetical protein